jgi:hypothetical protein
MGIFMRADAIPDKAEVTPVRIQVRVESQKRPRCQKLFRSPFCLALGSRLHRSASNSIRGFSLSPLLRESSRNYARQCVRPRDLPPPAHSSPLSLDT